MISMHLTLRNCIRVDEQVEKKKHIYKHNYKFKISQPKIFPIKLKTCILSQIIIYSLHFKIILLLKLALYYRLLLYLHLLLFVGVVWPKLDKDEEAASSTIIDLLIVIGSAMNEIKDVLGFLVHYVFFCIICKTIKISLMFIIIE